MYFNFFGGSSLLHLLAAHPKVVAVFGIVATVAYLSTPFGPRPYAGAASELRQLEQSLQAAGAVDEYEIENAAAVAERIDLASEEALQAVTHAIRRCGQGCAELTPAVVMRDPELARLAVFVAELDFTAGQRAVDRAAGGRFATR